MPGFENLGKLLLAASMVVVAVVLLLIFAARIPGFGRLPGDWVFQRGNFTYWIPLGSMLVLSFLLSMLLSLIAWILRR